MIYLDNAATGGYKPDCVCEVVAAALKQCANPGRSGHSLSLACLERVYACRKLLCEFFGGYSYDRTVFTKSCTEALNIAIFGALSAGDRVVTTVAEHNSVLRPLEHLKKQGVTVAYAPLNANGGIDIPALISLVTQNTKAVIVTLASNVTGASADIYAIRSKIPKQTLLICDGAQACGHEQIDMKEMGIDALSVAGHKGMLAMQGSGVLLFSERFNPKPLLFGGTGSESYNLNMPDFYPDALESGTLSYPAIVSLAEGAMYLKAHFKENRDKILHLTRLMINGLSQIKGVTVYSKINPFGIAAFDFDNIQSEMAAYRYSEEFSICLRGGLQCAPLMHNALGTNGLVRASLSAFNSEGEVNAFLSATQKLAMG